METRALTGDFKTIEGSKATDLVPLDSVCCETGSMTQLMPWAQSDPMQQWIVESAD
jgi:hypothetical protein